MLKRLHLWVAPFYQIPLYSVVLSQTLQCAVCCFNPNPSCRVGITAVVVVAAVVVALVSRICMVFALPTASFGTARQRCGILDGSKRQAFDIDATDLPQPGSLTRLKGKGGGGEGRKGGARQHKEQC